jgi:N-acyl-D-amino-acid deacylase
VLAWSRDRKLFPLEEAVRKMTSLPADTLRIPRGRIAEGAVADLVVFDPTTVLDTATFENPRQHPEGIIHVQTGRTPGEVITR